MEMKRLKGPNYRGVRLHHPGLRNCIFTVAQLSKPYPVPFDCPMCGVTHIYKTFHLNLNENGDVCVDQQIYDLFLREGIIAELKATKEVTPAPTKLAFPNINNTGGVLEIGKQNGAPARPQQPVYQPPIVYSREQGLVKLPGMNGHHAMESEFNAVQPPSDRFRREPDGTWTDLEKES